MVDGGGKVRVVGRGGKVSGGRWRWVGECGRWKEGE